MVVVARMLLMVIAMVIEAAATLVARVLGTHVFCGSVEKAL